MEGQTNSERLLEEFKDIKIEEFDENRSRLSRGALYNLYLRLSVKPSAEWAQLFDQSRSFPRHTMWRKAWIEGKFIVIECVPEELKKYHLADLKEDVTNANGTYKEYLKRCIQKERESLRIRDDERQRLKSIKGSLDFD